MKRQLNIFFTLTLVSCLLLLTGCRNSIIPIPTENSTPQSVEKFGTPKNFTASQGKKGSIDLTWEGTPFDSSYIIYVYNSVFQEDNSPIDVKRVYSKNYTYSNLEDGKNLYFSIAAQRKSDNQLSAKSTRIIGSTLDKPYITEILFNDENDKISTTVNWIMKNCTEDTYRSKILYDVTVYSETGKILNEYLIKNGESALSIENLDANTNYSFSVSSYLSDNDSKKLQSDIIDKKTAALITPVKPENLTASQGTDNSQIELSWNLPPKASYKTNNVFENKELYFSIERKVSDQQDSEFISIADYIGTNTKNGSIISGTPYYIDVDGNILSSKEIESSTKIDTYTTGLKVNFADKTAEPDKKYVYRVRSYTDVAEEKITGTTSSSEIYGWLVPSAQLTVSSKIILNDDKTQIEKIEISVNPHFNDFGNSEKFAFYITIKRSDFENNESQEEILYSDSNLESLKEKLNNLNSAENHFQKDGYYHFYFYICDSSKFNTDSLPVNDSVYRKAEALDVVTIISGDSAVPDFSTFNSEGGYSDKLIVNWKMQDDFEYTLKSYNTSTDNTETFNITSILENTEKFENILCTYNSETDLIKFEQTVPAGTKIIYSLIATNKDSGVKHLKSLPAVSTLGIPQISKEQKKYDSLCVSWEAVENATEYNINAQYLEDNKVILNASYSAEEILPEKNGKIYFNISKPEGFNTVKYSGKDIEVTVKAINKNKNAESTGSIITSTLGTGNINLKASEELEYDSLCLTWKEVPEAQGYIIYRTSYKDVNGTKISSEDKYYVDSTASKIQCLTGDIIKGSVEISKQGSDFKLKDIYAEPKSDTDSYQLNQSKIPFGIPYGYFVIPVFDQNNITVSDSKINYKKSDYSDDFSIIFTPVKASTIGYGSNIECNKSESSSIQTITWNAPVNAKKFTANLYRRIADSNVNEWTKVDSVNIGTGKTSVSYSLSGNEKYNAYEYLIVYGNKDRIIKVEPSLIKDLSSQIDNRYENCTEQKNKGYLLTINYNAKYGGTIRPDNTYASDDKYYSEVISWEQWDYSKKQIGPVSGEVLIFNKNNNNGWETLCTLDKNGKRIKNNQLTNIVFSDCTDTRIYIAPEHFAGDFLNNEEIVKTEGPLQILRDAKHYYAIKLVSQSKNEETEENIVSEIGMNYNAEDAVYAYRQITDAELIKCTNLIFAEVFSTNTSDSRTIKNSEDDYFEYKKITRVAVDYLNWTFKNYIHNFNSTPGDNKLLKSFLTINSDETTGIFWNAQKSSRIRTVANSSKEASKDTTVDLNIESTIPLESYNATVSFSYNDNTGYFYITRNNDEENVKKEVRSFTGNKTVLKQWSPLPVGENKTYEEKETAYGWWN